MRPVDDIAIAELMSSVGTLVRRVRAEAPGENRSLSWTQMAIIKHLDREGPSSSARLARAEGMKPQSMGPLIFELEEMGLVERKPHPSDGRQYLIKLTPKGAAARKASQEARRSWFAEAIGKLSKSEQATLFAAGEIIKRMVEG